MDGGQLERCLRRYGTVTGERLVIGLTDSDRFDLYEDDSSAPLSSECAVVYPHIKR